MSAVAGTETLSFLDARKRTTFPSAQAGLEARVLDLTFDPQTYGIALPPGSPLRKNIDVALLDAVHTDWWQQTLFAYTGQR